MDVAALRQLFDWGFCQRCMMVNEGWDPVISSRPCPSCGVPGTGTEWPPSPTRLLLRRAFHHRPADQEEFAFQAFVVAETIDIILAWVLRAAIAIRSAENPRTLRLVDTAQDFGLSTKQRLDLLKKVGGVRLQQMALMLDEADFPARWDDLRQRRDHFLGSGEVQNPLAFDGLTQEDLLEVSRKAVKIFAQVNNAVW